MQDCSNSSVLAMELLQSCTKPSIYSNHFSWWHIIILTLPDMISIYMMGSWFDILRSFQIRQTRFTYYRNRRSFISWDKPTFIKPAMLGTLLGAPRSSRGFLPCNKGSLLNWLYMPRIHHVNRITGQAIYGKMQFSVSWDIMISQ